MTGHSGAPKRIAIIGAGAGGIAMGVELKRAGLHNFLIFDKADGVGGVWRANDYPGSGCDVESHLYSFSFEPNPDWSRTYARQPEILDYFERTVDNHGLRQHLVLNTAITSATWEEATSTWKLVDGNGAEHRADFIVNALGMFGEPNYPNIPGIRQFEGTLFHSAAWEHQTDFAGKTVAIVGVGASAVQFAPEVAKEAKAVQIYQREAGWVVPKEDTEYSPVLKRIFKQVPFARTLYRFRLWSRRELGTIRKPEGRLYAKRAVNAVRHLEEAVHDPALKETLRPSYPVGCKRLVRTSQWYPLLTSDSTELVNDPIRHVEASGITTKSGVHRPADIIILGTGFKATRYLHSMSITGRGGLDLHRHWDSEGAKAYLGMVTPGFPNMFIMYGPNTNASNSIIYMLECQARYIRNAVAAVTKSPFASLEVQQSVAESYESQIQEALKGTVWLSGCASYFLDEHGKVRTQWPYRTFRYWWKTRWFDPNKYVFAGVPVPWEIDRPDPESKPDVDDKGAGDRKKEDAK